MQAFNLMDTHMSSIPTERELSNIFNNDEVALKYLDSRYVFPPQKPCHKCGGSMNKNIKRMTYSCPANICRAEVSLMKGTFFYNAKLGLGDILRMGYYWLNKIQITKIVTMTGHSSATVTNYIKAFRLLVSCNVPELGAVIGGENVEVEIDGSKCGKRKYYRGHRVDGVWVVGGVERTPERRMFFVFVEKRDHETMRRIIATFVRPGSIVYTDMWPTYSFLDNRPDYTHGTVNHSQHFLDPNMSVHTNTIEGTWNGSKTIIRPQHRTKGIIDDCLWEYVWRRENSTSLWNSFIDAMAEIVFNEC